MGRAGGDPRAPCLRAGHLGRPESRPALGPGLVDRLRHELGFTPPAAGEGWSRAGLEAWLEGRLLAVVGGVALLLGAVFFLSLAFSRGWITEPLRVLIGLVVGAGLLVLGELSFTRLRGTLGHVLVAVGLATVSLALLAATRLYQLVPVEYGLLGAFVAAVAAAAIAVRHDSQLVAAFGLIAVLASPPVLGASPTIVTLLFVAATLVGTTGVALFRTWIWLPPLAFVLAGPQLASYVTGGPPVAEGLIAIAGFWLVNVVAAGGEETRHATDRLRTTTVTLLLADAAFTMWAGFAILSGPQEAWRGTFLAIMAVAHLALGLLFLVRNGDRHPFGLVVAATGVATLTMAVPVQFGGPPVPIAWAAEAVALAWVAVLRRHPYSAGVSVLLATLALGHLVAIEYSPVDLVAGFGRSIPFVGPEGMTFAFMMAALAVAGLIVRIAWVRAWFAVVGGLVAIYVFPFELSGPALLAGWAILATAGFGLYARVVMRHIRSDFREDRVAALGLPEPIVAPVAEAVSWLSAVVRPCFVATAVIAGAGAIAHLAVFDYPALSIYAGTPHAIPFVGLPGLAFAIVLAAIGRHGAARPDRLGTRRPDRPGRARRPVRIPVRAVRSGPRGELGGPGDRGVRRRGAGDRAARRPGVRRRGPRPVHAPGRPSPRRAHRRRRAGPPGRARLPDRPARPADPFKRPVRRAGGPLARRRTCGARRRGLADGGTLDPARPGGHQRCAPRLHA